MKVLETAAERRILEARIPVSHLLSWPHQMVRTAGALRRSMCVLGGGGKG